LSDYGFRSITTLQLTNNLADIDIGSPVDKLVRESLATNSNVSAFYFYGTGQYMCGIGDKIYVYSVSRTSKIFAWSQYKLPYVIDDFAEHNQKLYLRSGDNVYVLDDQSWTDNGQLFETVIQMPYMDMKSPGQLKRIYGIDFVVDGTCDFSIAFDANNEDAHTSFIHVSGNTRTGGMIPIECCGTEFSIKIKNNDANNFELYSITVYYDVLGAI